MITYEIAGFAFFAILTLVASHVVDPEKLSPRLFMLLYVFTAVSAASAFAQENSHDRLEYNIMLFVGAVIFAGIYLLSNAIAADLRKPSRPSLEEIHDDRK